MHDIADLERRGVVGVFLASSVFVDAVAAQSASLGFPAACVFVPHPVQDRTDDELVAVADEAYARVVAAVSR